jgi:uncharacterized protein (DUF885 family)
MPAEFVPLAGRVVDALLLADPKTASSAGDHRSDAELPDYSPDGIMARVAMLRDASDALSQVDIEALPPEERVDHNLLSSMVEAHLFHLTELRTHSWDPLQHNPGSLLHALIARPFAPVAQRLESLAGRLEKIPDALATARTVLRDCPRIHLETAATQFAGAAVLVRDEVPKMLAEAPALTATVRPLAEAATAALEEFSAWCAAQPGGRDPRLGRRLWEAKLWHTLETELPAAEVFRRAEAQLEEATERLREVSAQILGGDADIKAALDLLANDHPDNATIIGLAKESLEDTTRFVAEHDLVTLIDDPCIVQEMPEFARGVAVAYCDPPGPLETADVPTFYCISPTPRDWSAERVVSFYREYNNHMMRNLTVHEAMPGHFLQLAHGRRYHGSNPVRQVGFSGTFVEGWAVYAEEVMVEHGFGGLPVRAQQLKMQLRMTINAILDQLLHCEDLTEADAMELMQRKGFQEEGEAAGKWRRVQLSSTQLSTYFVGYSEVSEIGRARPAGTTLRAWHDAMLAQGSRVAPRHLRTILRAGM